MVTGFWTPALLSKLLKLGKPVLLRGFVRPGLDDDDDDDEDDDEDWFDDVQMVLMIMMMTKIMKS